MKLISILAAAALVFAPAPVLAEQAVGDAAALGVAAAAQGPWDPRVPEPDLLLPLLVTGALVIGGWLLLDALLSGDDDELPASP